MGKGQIMSGGTNGQYQVKLILSRENITTKIAGIDAQIVQFDIRIADLPDGVEKDLVVFQKNILIKQKDYLLNTGNMPDDPTISAWCVDLTEDLSGIVGTIEIPGERGTVNIQPGHEDNAAYNQTRDGQLQPTIASKSAAATFYNLAMLSGWQKWMPNFRYGTITAIDTDNDTCNVILSRSYSSQQTLDINYDTRLTDVPMEYMSCNSAVFELGDEVVIKFSSVNTKTTANWDTATVIGFKKNPRSCGFSFKLTRGDGTLITEIGGLSPVFTVKDSIGGSVSISAAIYDIVTEQWSFQILDTVDSAGYFVSYDCDDGISTQYPYRYKTADKENSDDLISMGSYIDIIPYWKIEESTTIDGLSRTYYACNRAPAFWPSEDWNNGVGWSNSSNSKDIYFKTQGAIYEIKIKVYSSVPYRINRYLTNTPTPLVPRALFSDGDYCEWEERSIVYAGGGINYTLTGTNTGFSTLSDTEDFPLSIAGVDSIFTITDNSDRMPVGDYDYYVTTVPVIRTNFPYTNCFRITASYDY